MILLRCDVCERVVENPKLMFSAKSPVVLGNGTLLNPEGHVCVMCMVHRLKAVSQKLRNQCGTTTETVKEGIQKGHDFIVDEIIRADAISLIPDDTSTSVMVIPKLERANNGLRKHALPKPVFSGSKDIETVFKEALKDMKTKGTKKRVVAIHDSYGNYVGEASLDSNLNLWVNYKNLCPMIPHYSGQVILSKHPHDRHFDLVWNELTKNEFVYVRVYKGSVSVYTYFGYTKEQVKYALKELDAKVLKLTQKKPKVFE